MPAPPEALRAEAYSLPACHGTAGLPAAEDKVVFQIGVPQPQTLIPKLLAPDLEGTVLKVPAVV